MDARATELSDKILAVVRSIAERRGIELPDGLTVAMERPKREGQGDWSTNVAMKLSRVFGMPPLELGRMISGELDGEAGIKAIDCVPPGFINITLAGSWIGDVISAAILQGDDYGRSDHGRGVKIQVEFVSANPTGPIHLGHGRGAAVGDIIASVLEFSGYDVDKEYYVNDAGIQMEKLAGSVQASYLKQLGREAVFPEDGYPGEYIDDIASVIISEYGTSLADADDQEALSVFRDIACKRILAMIKKDLDDFGVSFDVWFSERSLYSDDTVPEAIRRLKEKGIAYDHDGAVWFKASELGDEKDRVMIKQDGVPTYFTSDMAYLKNKYSRGYDRILYVWGADHHGYIPRVRAINRALGKKDDQLEFLLIQFVSLLRGGVPVAMSKRAGTYLTLRDVIDEVGSDAARFSFVSRKCDSHLDIDLEMIKQRSSDNPVYYVQYAHARICSILREAEARGIAVRDVEDVDLSVLDSACEIDLVKTISRLPEEVERAARDLEPYKITSYALDAAEAFHIFYNTHKVLGEDDDIVQARLQLVRASRVAVKNALRLLGVSAPERM